MPALKVCSSSGCHELVPTGRCDTCNKAADTKRGTSRERGYSTKGHRTFRAKVLAKNPICVICRVKRATVADHYPHSRRDLVRMGLNPNDPQYGRGLCKKDHDQETARHQPGGWNAGN